MYELLEVDKNANDETMRDACYTRLKENQPDKMQKVEDSKSGWKKYWEKVVQSEVRRGLRFIL